MKKIVSVSIIIFIGVLVFSCNQHCEMKDNIFRQDYQSKEFSITEETMLYNLLDDLDHLYCEQDPNAAWPILMYNPDKQEFTSKGNGNRLIGLEPTPCFEAEFDLQQVLEVIKDGNNFIIENKQVPFDSIHSYVEMHYLNYGKNPRFAKSPEGAGIWIITYEKTLMTDLIPLMEEVCIGFENVCEQYAKDKFEKKICKLDPHEYKELKELFPFHLAFKTYDKQPELKVEW